MNDSEMTVAYHPTPWNKGKLIGQKPPLKLREIWADGRSVLVPFCHVEGVLNFLGTDPDARVRATREAQK